MSLCPEDGRDESLVGRENMNFVMTGTYPMTTPRRLSAAQAPKIGV